MGIEEQCENKAMLLGFIPHRLDIAGRPEWDNFPLNVLFVSHNGRQITNSALYEPDFHTYREEGHLSSMRYRNIYGGDCYLLIAYDGKNKQYRGDKFVNGELVSSASGGDDWNRFFYHLTLLGLAEGEKCKLEKVA